MDVVLAGGVTRAIVSTSGECNVFDDARAASSSISAADKENNKEEGGIRQVCSCTASRP